jgi:hypothetical protein
VEFLFADFVNGVDAGLLEDAKSMLGLLVGVVVLTMFILFFLLLVLRQAE